MQACFDTDVQACCISAQRSTATTSTQRCKMLAEMDPGQYEGGSVFCHREVGIFRLVFSFFTYFLTSFAI